MSKRKCWHPANNLFHFEIHKSAAKDGAIYTETVQATRCYTCGQLIKGSDDVSEIIPATATGKRRTPIH